MKRYAAIFAAALLGAAVGAFVTGGYYVRAIRAAFPSAIQAIEQRQEYSCAISLGVLKQLEEGNTDRAKLFLAREVASYYHHPFTESKSPRRQEMLARIETLRTKSSVLNRELSKNPQ
jgi:hypothetical protein